MISIRFINIYHTFICNFFTISISYCLNNPPMVIVEFCYASPLFHSHLLQLLHTLVVPRIYSSYSIPSCSFTTSNLFNFLVTVVTDCGALPTVFGVAFALPAAFFLPHRHCCSPLFRLGLHRAALPVMPLTEPLELRSPAEIPSQVPTAIGNLVISAVPSHVGNPLGVEIDQVGSSCMVL